MFDKLDDMLIHYEELMRMLGDPDVTQDTKRFTKLMKEQAELAPIVEAYKQYKQAKQDVEDSLAMLDEENDEEMRSFFFQKTRTMTRTLFWRSVQAQAVTRQLFSQLNFTVCIPTTQTASTGK